MHHNLAWPLLLVTCFPLSIAQCNPPDYVTKLHNQIRQAVAKRWVLFGDDQKNVSLGGKGSKSLFALTYDNSLEGVAQAVIDPEKCKLNKELVSQLGKAVNFARNRDKENVGFAYAIDEWLDTAESPLSATYNPSNPESEKFANMVYYKSLKLGCCSQQCTYPAGTKLRAYACAYSATPQKGQPLYIEESTKKGCAKKSCTKLVSKAKCDNTAECEDDKCENCCGLCTTDDPPELLDSSTASTSSTAETSSTSSSSQATTTSTMNQESTLLSSQAPSSSTKDQKSSPLTSPKANSPSTRRTTPGQATTSKGSSGCMTDDTRNQVVNAINEKRASLAKGQVQNGPKAEKLQPASNMYRMSYDTALENEAQTYTNTCPPKPGKSDLSTRTDHGETTMILDDNNTSCENALKNATDTWWNEITRKALNKAVKYTQVLEQSENAPTNFTQMAWALSYKIGCGVSNCNYGTIVVCRYYVRGNIYSQYIYRIGTNCGACSSSCTDGLCKAPN